MPTVTYQDQRISCDEGRVLRDVLLDNDLTPHRGIARRLNCRGHGTCGTCAVRVVEGPVRESRQSLRLRLTTHDDLEEVRLACEYEITEDITIEQP